MPRRGRRYRSATAGFTAIAQRFEPKSAGQSLAAASVSVRKIGRNGNRVKNGHASSIGIAFVQPWLACVGYVAVAGIWIVPDRRFERLLKEGKS